MLCYIVFMLMILFHFAVDHGSSRPADRHIVVRVRSFCAVCSEILQGWTNLRDGRGYGCRGYEAFDAATR